MCNVVFVSASDVFLFVVMSNKNTKEEDQEHNKWVNVALCAAVLSLHSTVT